MNENLASKTDLRVLQDNELDVVNGGTLDAAPLGTQQLFWDPLWWEVGRTGHLPTVGILPIPR